MSAGKFRCRACDGRRVPLVISLGRTPLANALLSADQLDRHEETYPLDLVFCEDCTLVQITETVPPSRLFADYAYFSSFSDTMLRHAETLVERVIRDRQLTADALVAEIASNDGYLLQFYRRAGIRVLGIEPAANIAKVAEERGIPTVVDFFGESCARTLAARGERADVIHANNVLAHVPDLPGFARGLATLLSPGGVAIVEVPYVRDLIDHREFDTIYHEHLSYFSLTAIHRLCARHDLTVIDVERLPIHGGSLRVTIGHAGGPPASPAVARLLEEEEVEGVTRLEFYQRFANDVADLRRSLLAVLADLRAEGKRLAAYGAAAKGSTLLNYFGIGRDYLDYVVDRSPHKQGRYMPGVHLPIHAPSRLLEDRPDCVLLLTWNFADEILEQQAEFRQGGGRFIIPVPAVRVA
jgi:2-polyprenyl-3-methyl-5-hydroxy-6-metoxy-1,4-benzoquinol methylase